MVLAGLHHRWQCALKTHERLMAKFFTFLNFQEPVPINVRCFTSKLCRRADRNFLKMEHTKWVFRINTSGRTIKLTLSHIRADKHISNYLLIAFIKPFISYKVQARASQNVSKYKLRTQFLFFCLRNEKCFTAKTKKSLNLGKKSTATSHREIWELMKKNLISSCYF